SFGLWSLCHRCWRFLLLFRNRLFGFAADRFLFAVTGRLRWTPAASFGSRTAVGPVTATVATRLLHHRGGHHRRCSTGLRPSLAAVFIRSRRCLQHQRRVGQIGNSLSASTLRSGGGGWSAVGGGDGRV